MVRKTILALTVVGVLLAPQAYAQQKVASTAKQSAHKHDQHGPHGGELIEVGNEEYHLEMVLEEKKNQLDVYVLDSKGESAVAIDAPSLALNLKIAGKPTQFKLKPVSQEKDKSGTASCFSFTSADLIKGLHHKNADARLSIKIAQKNYVLKIAHDHDHSAHAHGKSAVKR